MAGKQDTLYSRLKSQRHHFDANMVAEMLKNLDETRVEALAASLSTYIAKNLPDAINRRNGLSDYRTNPYVLLTSASVMSLSDPAAFASFLFNNKLYMGLETSFGKSVEAAMVGPYPLPQAKASVQWIDPPEKGAERASLAGLSNEEKARVRTNSIWREIDKSCVVGRRRYMTTIKSGPNCINDTQVEAMKTAIVGKHMTWLAETRKNYPRVRELDIVVGITYGTDRTTNNKENQILVKLLEHGFVEEDREHKPGVLIDSATESVRVYRRIGQDFWAFIGNPVEPSSATHVFLEVLIALARALALGAKEIDLETRLNLKINSLASALSLLKFPRNSLPSWVKEEFTENQLFWLATGMSAFYDEGI